jgi:prophage maintenance system killer protein
MIKVSLTSNIMAKANTHKNTEMEIYNDGRGPAITVSFENDTIWLSQQQIASLFKTDRSSVTKHIRNIIKTVELSEKSNVQFLHIANSDKPVKYYNLDFILSVGYRVNSQRATQFRIWATQRLRDYLLKGYAINKDRLKDENLSKVKELQTAVSVIQKAIQNKQLEGYEKEVLNIITDYANTWTLLYEYDENKIKTENGTKKIVAALDYDRVINTIEKFRARLVKDKQASDLFGREVGNKLKALLGNVEQTFDSRNLYKSLEDKAAHLLYFAIKDHPFVDGNKRIGALMFMVYLIENNRVYNKRGERIINDSTLTALALLIAESKPSQKEVMVRLVASLIVKK